MTVPRILLLTAAYPTEASPIGGIFVRDQVEALSTSCNVRVVHLDRQRSFHRPRRVDGSVPTWRVEYPEKPRSGSLAGLVAAGIAGARAACKDGFAPDVVHAHFFLAGLPALVVGRLKRAPVVVTEHWSVFLPEDPATLRGPLRVMAKFVLGHADLVLTVSSAMERGIQAHGINARTQVVPNLIDESLFHPPPPREPNSPPRLLSVGVLYEAKGIELLLEAVSRLRTAGIELALDIVGDGPLRATLEHQAGTLGVDVRFLGIRPKDDVAKLMRAADLFVLPSRYDNNPVALIEALACGLPAVASAVGGVPDIVGADGILTTPDVEAVESGIAKALHELASFDRAAIAGRAAARYGSSQVTSELRTIYGELMNDRSSQRQADE